MDLGPIPGTETAGGGGEGKEGGGGKRGRGNGVGGGKEGLEFSGTASTYQHAGSPRLIPSLVSHGSKACHILSYRAIQPEILQWEESSRGTAVDFESVRRDFNGKIAEWVKHLPHKHTDLS